MHDIAAFKVKSESMRLTDMLEVQRYRVIVKLVQKQAMLQSSYSWLEMSFFLSWSVTAGLTVWCFDPSEQMQELMDYTPAGVGPFEVLRWSCEMLERMYHPSS